MLLNSLSRCVFSLFECASFSVLWKVLLSVGPRLTPTETVNYQRWQRSFHLATITHIPQPPSKDLQSPTQVQGRCSVGTSWGGGEQVGVGTARWVCLTSTLHQHNTVRTHCILFVFILGIFWLWLISLLLFLLCTVSCYILIVWKVLQKLTDWLIDVQKPTHWFTVYQAPPLVVTVA